MGFARASESPMSQNQAQPRGEIVPMPPRVQLTLETAEAEGLRDGAKDKRISGRVRESLHRAAEARTGLKGNDLLEYALAKVALEDDFAATLLALEGSVDKDLDLEF